MPDTKHFVAFIQGATLDDKPDFTLPQEDYRIWFFKEGRAVLYLRTLIANSKRLFIKHYRGHNEIT